MPGKGAKQRARYFEQFSRQPGHHDLTGSELFFCPICRRPFDEKALDSADLQLTLAHVIPKALGGTWTTLACITCNNDDGGTGLEADLASSFRLSDWAHGAGSLKVRMGDSGKVRAEVKRIPAEKRLVFKVTTPVDSPAAAELKRQIKERMHQRGSEAFQFKIPLYRGGRCWGAVCQSAYLLLFRYFGYDFARHPTYGPLREQILHPDEPIVTDNIFILDDETALRVLQGSEAAVVFVRDPIRALLAILRYRSIGGINLVLAVVLPGPDEPPPPMLDKRPFSGELVPYEPHCMAALQGFFWWRWHDWLGEYVS